MLHNGLAARLGSPQEGHCQRSVAASTVVAPTVELRAVARLDFRDELWRPPPSALRWRADRSRCTLSTSRGGPGSCRMRRTSRASCSRRRHNSRASGWRWSRAAAATRGTSSCLRGVESWGAPGGWCRPLGTGGFGSCSSSSTGMRQFSSAQNASRSASCGRSIAGPGAGGKARAGAGAA